MGGHRGHARKNLKSLVTLKYMHTSLYMQVESSAKIGRGDASGGRFSREGHPADVPPRKCPPTIGRGTPWPGGGSREILTVLACLPDRHRLGSGQRATAPWC